MVKRNILMLLMFLGLFAASVKAQTPPCSDTITNSVSETICGGDVYIFGNMRLSNAGTYHFTFMTDEGCDSTVTLRLNVVQARHDVDSACDIYRPVGSSQTYTESGVYLRPVRFELGCMLVDTLTLTINHAVYNVIDTAVCNSITIWDDSVYTETGRYYYRGQTVSGCDRYDTLNLTVNTGTFIAVDTTVCDTFVWVNGNGQKYFRTGRYHWYHYNALGCPSVDTLHLVVNKGIVNRSSEVACDSFLWVNGVVYRNSFTTPLSYMYVDSNGCTSYDTLLSLTIYHGSARNDTVVGCDKASFAVTSYYTAHFTRSIDTTLRLGRTVEGCDSLTDLHVVVFPSWRDTVSGEVCDSLVWRGVTYTSDTVVSVVDTTVAGCDSVLTLNLTVRHSYYTEFYIITSDPYRYGDSLWSESGVYRCGSTAMTGCDSVVIIHLEITDTTHVWGDDSTTHHWAPSIHLYSFANRIIMVSHYSNDSLGYIDLYQCRWYRDGVLLDTNEAPMVDHYVGGENGLQTGCYYAEVALNAQLTDWTFTDTLCINNGKSLNDKPQIGISPNPVRTGASVSVTVSGAEQDAVLSLYDMQGRLHWTKAPQDGAVIIDAQLSTGVYVLQLATKDGGKVIKKLVVR